MRGQKTGHRPNRGAPVVHKRSGSVCTDGIKSGMTNRKLTRITVDQVQADRKNDVDADEDQDLIVVGPDQTPQAGFHSGQEGKRHQPEDPLLHTFSFIPLPMMPVGFRSRIKTRMMKAIASR